MKIEGMIYGFTDKSLRDQIEQALRDGASVIVIELDTPGGTVESALRICKYLKTLGTPTVAWINPHAYSAGIMIASACGQIVMAPASATGDCAPIMPGMNLAPTERAKALSPILEEFRDSARVNGYDFVLFHAMCELGVEVYQIENPSTGQRRLVNQADYQVMVKGRPLDKSLTPQPQKKKSGTEHEDGGEDPDDEGFSDIETGPADVDVATEADRGQWQLVAKIHDGRSLLTLSQQRAMDVGLAKAIVRDEHQLKDWLGAGELRTVLPSTVAVIAYWLTEPWVRSLLFSIMLMGLYSEMQAPGFGFAGLVAVTALAMLLIAPYLVGLAQIWHILLFFVGLLLLGVEVFVIPGFGLIGLGGIVCMLIGLVLMVVPAVGEGPIPMPAPEMVRQLHLSIQWTVVGLLISAVGLYAITKYFGKIPVVNRMVLRSSTGQPPATGSSSRGIDGSVGSLHVGATGTTITGLKPTGRARVNGQVLDVISQGEWIEAGREVRVIEVHGNRVVVEVSPSAET